MKHESNRPASTPTAVEAAVRLAAPKKDRTGAARSRRYRARKRAANRTLVPVERDATAITVTAVPALNHDASVTPSVMVLPARRSVAPRVVAVAVAILATILVIVGFYVNSAFLFAFGHSTEAHRRAQASFEVKRAHQRLRSNLSKPEPAAKSP